MLAWLIKKNIIPSPVFNDTCTARLFLVAFKSIEFVAIKCIRELGSIVLNKTNCVAYRTG